MTLFILETLSVGASNPYAGNDAVALAQVKEFVKECEERGISHVDGALYAVSSGEWTGE